MYETGSELIEAELDGLVRDLDPAGLTTPSRCPGWSVADVLLHLAQSNEMAVASVTGVSTILSIATSMEAIREACDRIERAVAALR